MPSCKCGIWLFPEIADVVQAVGLREGMTLGARYLLEGESRGDLGEQNQKKLDHEREATKRHAKAHFHLAGDVEMWGQVRQFGSREFWNSGTPDVSHWRAERGRVSHLFAPTRNDPWSEAAADFVEAIATKYRVPVSVAPKGLYERREEMAGETQILTRVMWAYY